MLPWKLKRARKRKKNRRGELMFIIYVDDGTKVIIIRTSFRAVMLSWRFCVIVNLLSGEVA